MLKSTLCIGQVLISFLFAGSAWASAPIPAGVDLPSLVEKILPGVVNVSSTSVVRVPVIGMDEFFGFWGIPQERKQSQTSLGSGFIIDKDGFVLTNEHVVHEATEVLVNLWDKRQFRARIIGKDQKMDLALLQIRDQNGSVPSDLTAVPLGNSDQVRIAESVFAVGNPFGLQHTVTSGIISAKNRTIGQGPFDNFIQTDASINPGNSGGPLFNMKGEVVGINAMIFSKTGQSGGVGFAIPVNEAQKLIPELKKYGRVPRPWLGVLAERMTPQIQAHFGLPVEKGVLVYNLVQGSPADRAGLEQGDIITSMAGAVVSEPFDVERILAKHKPKESVTAEVRRGRRSLKIEIPLSELPRRLDQLPRGII